MNLPETAYKFVDIACKAVKPEGGIMHFYGFIRLPKTIDALKQDFLEAVEQCGRKVERFVCAKTVRETAPFEWQAVLDAKII
jgi:tRNA G37 N-methylase Trm5